MCATFRNKLDKNFRRLRLCMGASLFYSLLTFELVSPSTFRNKINKNLNRLRLCNYLNRLPHVRKRVWDFASRKSEVHADPVER